MFCKGSWFIDPFDRIKFFSMPSKLLETHILPNGSLALLITWHFQLHNQWADHASFIIYEYMHFIANDPPKPNNNGTSTICVYLINSDIYIILCFSWNIFEYFQFYWHQCYHSWQRNHNPLGPDFFMLFIANLFEEISVHSWYGYIPETIWNDGFLGH